MTSIEIEVPWIQKIVSFDQLSVFTSYLKSALFNWYFINLWNKPTIWSSVGKKHWLCQNMNFVIPNNGTAQLSSIICVSTWIMLLAENFEYFILQIEEVLVEMKSALDL